MKLWHRQPLRSSRISSGEACKRMDHHPGAAKATVCRTRNKNWSPVEGRASVLGRTHPALDLSFRTEPRQGRVGPPEVRGQRAPRPATTAPSVFERM